MPERYRYSSAALFTIFPLLKTLREKGASIACIMAFVTAWSGKAPLLPLEIEFLGWRFAVLRICLVIPFAVTMGLLSQFILDRRDTHMRCQKAGLNEMKGRHDT